MAKAIFEINKIEFVAKALQWAQQFDQVCYLQSNGYPDEYNAIESLLGVDMVDEIRSNGSQTFDKIELFRTKYPNRWMLGFFGYDLKNEIEHLSTGHPDNLNFPDAYFFIPKIVLKFSQTIVEIESKNPELVFDAINKQATSSSSNENKISLTSIKKRMSKEMYLDSFSKMISHIKRGDIYEVNLCQEFYADQVEIDPISAYNTLNIISPTPFSTFFKVEDKFILSASPERFLAKRGQTLISQPIKGTAPRGKTKAEDEDIKRKLRNNPKEIAENVMIVDLVRNDMTQSAEPGTVTANRKLEIQSFQQVHQLVSTITGVKKKELSDIKVIKNLFPPGSMTGAPKISAMQLCDRYENSRRGIYSGAVGYFSPEGDFDFNVIIRTILYNKTRQYLSFHTGGALTYAAQAEQEYNECILKASAITTVLQAKLQ